MTRHPFRRSVDRQPTSSRSGKSATIASSSEESIARRRTRDTRDCGGRDEGREAIAPGAFPPRRPLAIEHSPHAAPAQPLRYAAQPDADPPPG